MKNTVDLPTWEELTDIRDTLNTAIDKELSRTTSDALFLALRRDAARDADIIRRNAITHPGFVPVIPLKVPVQ
nr:hypothetical protein [Escherichia coli]